MMTTVPIVLTILLIALLIKREFLHGMDGPRSRKLLRGLNVVIVPLLVVFLIMVGFQLRSGQSSEIAEIASASSVLPANPAITSSFDNIPVNTGSITQLAEVAPVVTQTPAATAIPTLSPAIVLQQVAAAETALHSGQIDATMAYPKGTRSSTRLIFDLTANGGANLHMTTLYTSTVGTHTYERIIIGNRSWELAPNGKWVAMATSQSVAEQVQLFLPDAASIQNATATSVAQAPVLQWTAPDKLVNSTLTLSPNDGIPHMLQRVTNANGEKLTVTYSSWNASVSITPPTKSK